MQIVINICKDDFEEIYMQARMVEDTGSLFGRIRKAISYGTPLKCHGKIIAEPTEEDIAKTVGGQNNFAECIKDAVKAVFDNAPTIIEADRSEEE